MTVALTSRKTKSLFDLILKLNSLVLSQNSFFPNFKFHFNKSFSIYKMQTKSSNYTSFDSPEQVLPNIF